MFEHIQILHKPSITQQITNQFTQIPLPDTHRMVKTSWNNHNKDSIITIIVLKNSVSTDRLLGIII